MAQDNLLLFSQASLPPHSSVTHTHKHPDDKSYQHCKLHSIGPKQHQNCGIMVGIAWITEIDSYIPHLHPGIN
jgi:hypothetical protein